MIKCIIVDDEPLAQEVLQTYIKQIPQLYLLGKCSNALEAFELMHQEQVDLIFMDIKMPGINGLDFMRSLKNPPAVIFTTAFANYAVTGFELDAVDYLLKPITFERFNKSVNKLLKNYQPETVEQKAYTYFKVSGRLIKIDHYDLLYAQSVKDYIFLCTTKGNHLTHMTMKYLNELLPSPQFLRLHRSYLVNKHFVSVINKNSIRVGNEVIPVSDSYRHNTECID